MALPVMVLCWTWLALLVAFRDGWQLRVCKVSAGLMYSHPEVDRISYLNES